MADQLTPEDEQRNEVKRLRTEMERFTTGIRELHDRCMQGARDNGDYYERTAAKYELGKATVWDGVAEMLRNLLEGVGGVKPAQTDAETVRLRAELAEVIRERDELEGLTDAQATAARETAEDHRDEIRRISAERDEARRHQRRAEARVIDAEQAARAVQAHADQMRAELETARAEHASIADRVARVHVVLAGATWRYAMVHARDVRAALTGADEGPPLVDVITTAMIAYNYPPTTWPDGPPGEGEHDRARREATAIVRAIAGSPELVLAAARRPGRARPHRHDFQSDWIDTDDVRCWCGARPGGEST